MRTLSGDAPIAARRTTAIFRMILIVIITPTPITVIGPVAIIRPIPAIGPVAAIRSRLRAISGLSGLWVVLREGRHKG